MYHKFLCLISLLIAILFNLPVKVSPSYLPCKFEDLIFDCIETKITFDRIPSIPKNATSALLSSKQIKTIKSSDFVDRGNLERLTLNKNQIKHIDQNSFLPLQKLRFLNLDYNKIYKLEFYTPLSLEHINLKGNDIAYISPSFMQSMHKIQEFDISENEIEKIPKDLFSKINVRQQQITLDFSNNRIQTFPKEAISNLIYNSNRYSKLKINLSGNPLRCNCLMKWVSTLQDDFSEHSVSHIDIQGTCEYPISMKSTNLYSLKPSEFNCKAPEIDVTVRTHIVLDEHDYGMIPCAANGDPKPTINFKLSNGVWLAQGESSGKYSVSDDGILIIDEVSIRDAQRIQCIASNIVKNTTIEIILTVNQQLSSTEKTKIVAAVILPLAILALLSLLLCCFCSPRVRKCCKPKRKMRYSNVNGKPVEDYRFPGDNKTVGLTGILNTTSMDIPRTLPNGAPSQSFPQRPPYQQFMSLQRHPLATDMQKSPKPASSTFRPANSSTMPANLRSTNLVVAQPPALPGSSSPQAVHIDGDKPMAPAPRSILFRKMSHPYVAAGTVTNGITVPAKLPATPLYIDPPEFEPRSLEVIPDVQAVSVQPIQESET